MNNRNETKFEDIGPADNQIISAGWEISNVSSFSGRIRFNPDEQDIIWYSMSPRSKNYKTFDLTSHPYL